MSVPNIAYAHHEKLNGRGYPRKLNAEDIPIQSRMMTISDIYDALTAADRPYKRAVPTDRALDILKMEVNDGLLDSFAAGGICTSVEGCYTRAEVQNMMSSYQRRTSIPER